MIRTNVAAVTIDMIFNHAARLCSKSGDQTNVLLVIRAMTGIGLQDLSTGPSTPMFLEARFARAADPKVAAPAKAADDDGLMGCAVDDPDAQLLINTTTLLTKLYDQFSFHIYRTRSQQRGVSGGRINCPDNYWAILANSSEI